MKENIKTTDIRFTILDIIDRDELQKIQDAFSNATGLASLITSPEGTPISKESNFTQLCKMIRGTTIGMKNCRYSDALIGKGSDGHPSIHACLSCGLLDAGTPIIVGGIHIANWLIGQVRTKETDEKAVAAYADDIGADRDAFMKAFSEVPMIELKRFDQIVESLSVIAGDLSFRAYNNVKQRELFRQWSQVVKDLESSKAHNMALLTALPDLVLLLDREGTILDIREGGATKALKAPEEIISKQLREVLPPYLTELTLEKLANLFETNHRQEYDYELEINGEIREFECRLVIGGANDAIAVIRDISSIRRANRALESSLKEKELLIKELFHRTKNNMQLIQSLLALQASDAGDEQVATALQKAEMKILAMSLVHQHLYRSQDLSSIDLKNYLQDLLSQLFDALLPNQEHISVSFSCAPVRILIDVAIPIGLIVNELISNAIKHAFPNDRTGTISLTMELVKERGFHLHFSDDGKGVAKDFSPDKTKSLGLKTVQVLVQQLEGRIEWEGGQGLAYDIYFESKGYRPRI